MKKATIFFATLSVLFVLQGCGDNPLDITPSGRTTLDKVFSESETTKSYLNSVYEVIPRYGNRYFLHTFLAGVTDNAYDSDASQSHPYFISHNWYDGDLTPTNNPLAVSNNSHDGYDYSRWWRGIRKANVFLANINDAVLEVESERPRLRAEAKVLRAFFYLELLKGFGGMPIVKEPLPVDFDYSKLERATFDEVVQQVIVEDIDDAVAESALPWRITQNNEARRFTKAVAYAIKSQALLYNASPLWNSGNNTSKWETAAEASKEALEKLTTNGGYALYPDYEEYFFRSTDYSNNPSDTETILEIAGSMTFFPFTNQLPIAGIRNYSAGIVPSQELVDSYNMQTTGARPVLGYEDEDHLQPITNSGSGYDPNNPYKDRDPRFYATVWYNGAYYGQVNGNPVTIETYINGAHGFREDSRNFTNTGYYLRKFVDPSLRGGNGQNSQATWKKYRLAEIYLNYAEAANEAYGPTSDVYNAVNAVRSRVNMPGLPSGLSKEEMRKRIRNERRVELAMEGHRFWDVRRWKILDQTDKLVTGMKIEKDSNDNLSYNRVVINRRKSWEDRYLIFPIPLNEITKTGFEQNPGW